MLVFVSLRPSTFYLSKTTGSLAAYQNKILTISPPPADEVVQRRILFALRVAQGQVAPAALPDIRLQLGNVVSFLKATARSKIGRAHVCTPVTNVHLVYRFLLEKT